MSLLPGVVMAQVSMQEIKSRMADRLPAVLHLLSDGKVGENNVGLLEARASLDSEEKEIVKAENEDRTVVFEAIGQPYGKSPQEVGKQRAGDFARRAPPGSWIQQPDGRWIKK